MSQYLRHLYLVKSDPNLLEPCLRILDQYCKTSIQYNSCYVQAHAKNSVKDKPLMPQQTRPSILWISETPPELSTTDTIFNSTSAKSGIKYIQPKHYRQILGQEFSLIVYDIRLGVRANPFYAVIGTLQLGGVMLLLSPTTDLTSLPSALPQSFNTVADASHFNELFADLFKTHFPLNIITRPEQIRHTLNQWSEFQSQRFSNTLPDEIDEQLMHAKNQQHRVLTNLINSIDGHLRDRLVTNESSEPNHHVLQADRGRGKSDLLGQLARHWLYTRHEQFNDIIIITQSTDAAHTIKNGLYRNDVPLTEQSINSPNVRTNDSANVRPNDSTNEQNNVRLKGHGLPREKNGSVTVRFCPPDDPILFSQTQYSNRLLLVDEAASLPVYWLRKAAQTYPNIVFATTIHGYENNGMGFSLSFLPTLAHYTSHHLTPPIRFVGPCPLEHFAQDVLDPTSKAPPALHAWHDGLHMVTKTQLLQEPQLRQAVMQCLMQAHYQTAPDDLQRLLDAPDMQCAIYIQQHTLIGCVWIVTEGNIQESELAQHIAQGSRRVNGHLSAQQMALTFGLPALLKYRIWRINRIVINPEYQGKGVGSQILQALIPMAKSANIQLLTSAFGASERLLSFWIKNRYKIIKKGQQVNPITGLVNAIVMCPIIELAEHKHIQYWQTIEQQWHALLHQKRELFGNVIESGYEEQFVHAQEMINEFISGKRSFDYAEVYIYWVMRYGNEHHKQTTELAKSADQAYDGLVLRYCNGDSLPQIVSQMNLPNKKAFIQAIKSQLQLRLQL